MKKHPIGTRVKFNDRVAFAFVGQVGTVTSHRESTVDGTLNIVTLDTPTPAATHWTPCETLAVQFADVDTIPGAPTGTHNNPIRYEHIDPTDPDRKAKRAAQREQFTKDAKAGKVLCLSDLMISHGM